MRPLTPDELRRSTLRRQFPDLDGRTKNTVLRLFFRIGPVQSQVPRAPFLAASSRLPGVSYDTVNDLLAEHRLTKASNLRGTVHTSTGEQFRLLDAAARATRGAGLTKMIGLSHVTPAQVSEEIERFCADQWRTRDDIVAHVRDWLAAYEPPSVVAAIAGVGAESYLWGHSGLLRRPRDGAWEKRTDVFRRTASALLPDVGEISFEKALAQLVEVHLGAYGPAQPADLSFFFGVSPKQVNGALASLGDAIIRLPGPDQVEYLDLAVPPGGGREDPGLVLLGEFDNLLLGFAGRNRLRFLSEEQLSRVWAKVNGLFSPVVLNDGRIVASWKTLPKGQLTDIEITMLPPHELLDDARCAGPIADVARALKLTIGDVRIRKAPER